MVLGAIFGSVFSIIVHKLNLTSGVIPSMGMAMALINFFTVKSWNAMLAKLNIQTLPFSPQVLLPALAPSLIAQLSSNMFDWVLLCNVLHGRRLQKAEKP